MNTLVSYNGRVGFEARFLWESGIMKRGTYDQNVARQRIEVLHRSAPGIPAVVAYDTLPLHLKSKVDRALANRGEAAVKEGAPQISVFESLIHEDADARSFYADYQLTDGRPLPAHVQTEYYNNAIVLNAVREMLTIRKGRRDACNISGNRKNGLFASVSADVNAVNRDRYPHTLPSNDRRLRDRYNAYFHNGNPDYESLIHKNYCNQNSRKVTEAVKWMILSLYCQKNNPYADWVHAQYMQFLAAGIDVVDSRTGQIFDRRDFTDENGAPLTISESTVWNIVNAPENKVLIDSIRMSYHKFGALSRPHHHRHNAMFSLSKVSLDDRDLPRKMHDGNRVKAYYAYDVCSGALIGAAYSRKKDTDLYIGCLRDMFRFLDRRSLGLPLEMEVENHLVNQFEDDLMRAGNLFPFVRWCAPTNSQEKHAEQFNRAKKYGYEKRYQDGIGRWYAKLPVNQTEGERFYNDQTDRYEIKEKTYSYEQLVADDMQMIEAYNNGLHRDQKTYPGKTRMQVFLENLNPQLKPMNRSLLLRYIGNHTSTRIQRNQYVQVQYADYQLESLSVLKRLKPGNYGVDAYWLDDTDGTIGEVYLYQGGQYVGKAAQIATFTTAQAEWTEADTAAMTEQSKYISKFDKFVREGKDNIANIKVLPAEMPDALDCLPGKASDVTLQGSAAGEVGGASLVPPASPRPADDDLDALMEKYSAADYREYAIEMA